MYSLTLFRSPKEKERAGSPRSRPSDKEQVFLPPYFDDLQALYRHLFRSHMARQSFSLPDPRRPRTAANRARSPVKHGPMGRRAARKVMAFYRTGKTLTLGNPSNIDMFPLLEEIGRDDGSNLKLFRIPFKFP